jgi:UDPglucose 6-dehydrogenase
MAKIGIIGFGTVGQAVYSNARYKNDILIFDKNKNLNKIKPLEKLKEECEAIFVCVGTPSAENGFCDTTEVMNVLDSLIDYEGIIILKSTIPYADLSKVILPNLCYNPEFLNEKTAIEDFQNQTYLILGGNADVTAEVKYIYEKYFLLSYIEKIEQCSIKEACDFKYIRNIQLAYKELFWEFVEDTTSNSRKLADMMKNIPTPEMDIVGLDGNRGFGGKCLPKDVSAWDKLYKHPLTNFILEYNNSLKNIFRNLSIS